MSETRSKVLDTTILNYRSVIEFKGCLYRYGGNSDLCWAKEYKLIPLAGQGKKTAIKISRNKIVECWLIEGIDTNSQVFGDGLQLSLFS